MGLFKHLRGKSRKEEHDDRASTYSYNTYTPYTNDGRNHIGKLSPKLLGLVFTFVCPHVQDSTYESCENSQIGEGCMLCDLRDLSNCAQVSRRWHQLAQSQLYTSIRIDAVHYCSLEEELADQRKKAKKHFRGKTVTDAGAIPGERLSLLCRTLRDNARLAQLVRFLKLPYMTREACKSDLAQTISVLRNLEYVDLPDGFYSGDGSCMLLRQEVRAQCPNLRKMTYRAGSEKEIEYLSQGLWHRLTILEIDGLDMELVALRTILASMPQLEDLTLRDMEWVDDSLFDHSALYPAVAPIRKLRLEDMPRMTATGLQQYLEDHRVRSGLTKLSLQNTGVSIMDLRPVLWQASALQSLAIVEIVSKSLLFTDDMSPLSSISLQVLSFEISTADDLHGRQNPAESYYTYLASCLHAGALPALTTLYVRDPGFPERLLIPPVPPPSARGHHASASISSGVGNILSMYAPSFAPQGGSFNQTLEVYSKGIDELEWAITAITPPSQTQDRRGSLSMIRPVSAVSASRGLGPQWAQGGFGGEARRSVIVGNGFGGFIAVPSEEVPSAMIDDSRPGAHSGDDYLKPPPSMAALTGSDKRNSKRASKHDLWR